MHLTNRDASTQQLRRSHHSVPYSCTQKRARVFQVTIHAAARSAVQQLGTQPEAQEEPAGRREPKAKDKLVQRQHAVADVFEADPSVSG